MNAEPALHEAPVEWHGLFQRRFRALAQFGPSDFIPLNDLDVVQRQLTHHEIIEAMPNAMAVVVSGWCFRYRLLSKGRRAIFNFWLPGDLINLTPMSPGHEVAAWGPTEIAVIANVDYRRLCNLSPGLVAVFTASERLNSLVLANQILRMGRLNAYERTAHFILEHWERAKLVGLTQDFDCPLPISQEVLADALGLTNCHVSRMLTRLRANKLIELERHSVRITDPARMMALCDYDRMGPILERGENRLRLLAG